MPTALPAVLRPLLLAALLCALPGWVAATGLQSAWQGAQDHDRELAAARAAHAAAAPQRRQADALWRPSVGLTASAGLGYGESEMRGAQFSAPGMGTNQGVDFGTSVTSGAATRVALQASQPLLHPERRAQQAQLQLKAQSTELQWQAAEQAAMLRTAQRYFDAALAQERLRVLAGRLQAVDKAAAEAQDRFDLGAAPITAVHEAQAQRAQLQAQQIAAQQALELALRALSDTTGQAAARLQPRLPTALPAVSGALADWQARADIGNTALRLQQLAADLARAEADRYRAAAGAKVELIAQVQQQRLAGSGAYGSGARNQETQALVGVQLTVPLSTGGWRSAKEEESLAQANAALAQWDAAREQTARQVQAAWLQLTSGQAQVQALQTALTASLAREDATRTGYEAGERTLLDVLGAGNDAAGTRLALAQARTGVLLARLQLTQLAGELDLQALRQADEALEP